MGGHARSSFLVGHHLLFLRLNLHPLYCRLQDSRYTLMYFCRSGLLAAVGIHSLNSTPWWSIWGRTAEIALAKLLLQDSCCPPAFLGWFIQAPRSFFGSSLSLDLEIFPMQATILLLIKDSILGILQTQNPTCLFLIVPSLTCCHLMLRILLMALWRNNSRYSLFLVERFHDSQPYRAAFMLKEM